MSQIFTVLSEPPLTIRFPSGLKLTLWTMSECPLSVSVSWPVWASQTFSVLSPATPAWFGSGGQRPRAASTMAGIAVRVFLA